MTGVSRPRHETPDEWIARHLHLPEFAGLAQPKEDEPLPQVPEPPPPPKD
jgi:hypothetical protein